MRNPTPPLLNPPSPSLSWFPDEIVVSILARIPRSHYRSLCSVSKRFHSLIYSGELYAARSQIGATEPRLYLCIGLPDAPHHRWFTLNNSRIRNGEIKGELRSVLVNLSYMYGNSPVRLDATTLAVGSEIYQIGGSKNNDKRSRYVYVLDCRSHTWHRATNMTVARRRAKSCVIDGKIYVTGGCRKREEAMNWGEILDLEAETWKPLPSPKDDGFDSSHNHKLVVLGGKLYVITKDQKKYGYDPKKGRWSLEVGFVGHINGPWCVIDNVTFTELEGEYRWYDSRRREWFMVEGLGDVYKKRGPSYRTIQLVNYGGKLAILWHERNQPIMDGYGSMSKGVCGNEDISISCAVIRLDKLSTNFGSEIWGHIECLNIVLQVPDSYKLLTCQSVSL